MRKMFKDAVKLFYPDICPVCDVPMPENSGLICNRCRWEIPLTQFWMKRENPVYEKLSEQFPLENASSFFFFIHESGFRDMIHKFKYGGNWMLARKMGEWYGGELSRSGLYGDIDVIVPVPLHWRKRLSRGYNQAEYIARGISSAMGVGTEAACVSRRSYKTSQTKRSRSERWSNVEGIFSVIRPERLRGRHILLVDDVLTTGATLASCGRTILEAVPDCRLSVATLAVSANELV